MAKTKKINGHEDMTLVFTAEVEAESFLRTEISQIEKTAKPTSKRSFRIGDNEIGHLEGKKGITGAWTITGQSIKAKDVKFTHPRADMDVVIHATARELAVIFSDTKGIAPNLEKNHNLELDSILDARIRSAGGEYDVLNDGPD